MTNTVKTGLLCGVLVIGGLGYLLAPVLTPFFIAGVLAYLGDPLVNRLVAFKIPRTLAALVIFLCLMLLALFIPLLLIPLLQQQLAVFYAKLPDIFAWLQQTAMPWLNQYLGISDFADTLNIKDTLAQHWKEASNFAAVLWRTVSRSGLALIEWFIRLLVIAVVTFYLLRDWDQVIDNAYQLLPWRTRPIITQLAKECNQVLSAFFRGQLVVMFALAIIYSLGLWLAGLQLALLIGLLAGVISIVPYLGFIVGTLLAGFIALIQYHDWLHIVYVLLVFVIGHGIESTILTPLLVGNRIGLHPVAVIFAILAGGQLFGFVGVLLALPVAAIIMVLLRFAKKQYLGSRFYS